MGGFGGVIGRRGYLFLKRDLGVDLNVEVIVKIFDNAILVKICL